MPFILILSLLLSKIFLQLIYLRLYLNGLLCLLLLFNCNLILHVLPNVSDTFGLLLGLSSGFVPLVLDLPQHHCTPIHLSIHRLNHFLSLLNGLFLHLQLLILVLGSLLELQTLLLLDLETVKQIGLEDFQTGSGILLVQEFTVHHVTLERQVLFLLVGLVV